MSEKDQIEARKPIEILCTEEDDIVCFDLQPALPRDSAPGGIFTKAMQLSAGGPDGYDRAHVFPGEADALPGGNDIYFDIDSQPRLTEFAGHTRSTKKRRENLSSSIRPSVLNVTCFTSIPWETHASLLQMLKRHLPTFLLWNSQTWSKLVYQRPSSFCRRPMLVWWTRFAISWCTS